MEKSTEKKFRKGSQFIVSHNTNDLKATIFMDDGPLKLKTLSALQYGHFNINYQEKTFSQIRKSRKHIVDLVKSKDSVFGQCTGLTFFSDYIIPEEDQDEFQINIIKSHSCGVGKSISENRIRMLLALRIHELSQAHTLISEETFKKLIEAFNNDILSYVPEQGSVSTADTQQLAHLISGLMGFGLVYDEDVRNYVDAKIVLAKKSYIPLVLHFKEAESLINSTTFVQMLGVENILRAENLALHADLIFSLTFEVLNGVHDAFHPQIHQIRNHHGQIEVASRIRKLIQDEQGQPSEMNKALKLKLKRVQDAYSIRCTPQVHGISNDTIKFVKNIMMRALTSVSDNPIIIWDPKDNERQILTSGSFHGEYFGKAFDFLAIGMTELANISERRIERLLNPNLSKLPAFLTTQPGKCTGFMMAQSIAASLTSENKVHCHPGSVDSIPTSANQQDHLSMASISLLKCVKVLNNLENVLTIELMCAVQAIEFHRPLKSTSTIENIVSFIRTYVPFFTTDESLKDYLLKMTGIINSGRLLEFINQTEIDNANE